MKATEPAPEIVDSYGASLAGRLRDANSDQFLVAEVKRTARVDHASMEEFDASRQFGTHPAHVLLVADGVSGKSDARRASRIAVDTVLDSILNVVPWTADLDVDSEADLRQELKKTVERCNDRVSEAGRRPAADGDMATTLTLAFVRWPQLFLVHAGDSRAYLKRDETFRQLTNDHTLGDHFDESSETTSPAIKRSQFASILWNAVGGDDSVTPDLYAESLQAGDSLLLCTDGLTSCLSDRSIAHVLDVHPNAKDACTELLHMVEHAGGVDDATITLARFGTTATPANLSTAQTSRAQNEATRPEEEPQVTELDRDTDGQPARAPELGC